jgi:hypothetical protein
MPDLQEKPVRGDAVQGFAKGQTIPGSEEYPMSDWEPVIASFLCNWCSYGAADLAGVSRLQYPTYFRVIRVPCSARVSPKFILAAFRRGADGVWVSG